MQRAINAGRLSELLRALCGITEHEPFSMEDAVRAVLALEVDRPEWGFLKNEQHFISKNIAQAAVAGQLSAVGLINRSSGTLVVVKFAIALGSQVTFFKGTLPDATFETGIATETPATSSDMRFGAVGLVAAREFNRATAAGVPGTSFGQGLTGATFPAAGANAPLVVLPPNSWVAMQGNAVNLAVSGVFVGYVRPLHQGVRA